MKNFLFFFPSLSFWLSAVVSGMNLNSSLVAQPRPELKPITVIATKSEKSTLDTAGSDSALSSEDLLRRGSVSIGDALKYEPGVSVPFDFTGADPLVPYLGSGEKAINLRGVEGNRISVSVDGIRQPQEFLTAGGMSGPGRVYFDPATFGQFELYKSASSSLYGSGAMGGAVNGRTVGPENLLGGDLKGYAARNASTFSSVNESFNNRLTAAYGDGFLAHSIVYSFREGSERKNNSNTPSDPQSFESNAGVLKTLYAADSWKLTAAVDLFKQNVFTDVDSIETGNNRNVTHDSQRTRSRLSLEGELFPAGGTDFYEELMARIYWQDALQESVNFQDRSDTNLIRRRDISFQTGITGIDLEANRIFDQGGVSHSFIYGMEGSISNIESKYLKMDTLQNGSVNFDDKKSMAPSEARRLGLFVLDEISLGTDDAWVVTPSLGFDYYKVSPKEDPSFRANTSSVGFNPVEYENTVLGSPGISVLRWLSSEINFYFSYNRGIRNPSAEELNGFFEHPPTNSTTSAFIIDANPNLKEETSDSFEIGTQGRFSSGVYEVSLYKNYYDGFIELTKQPSQGVLDLYSNENLGEVEIYGLELSVDWESSGKEENANAIEAGVSASWSKGFRKDLNKPLNSVEPWKTVFYLGYRTAENIWGSRVSATFNSAKKAEDIDHFNGEPPPVESSLVLDLVAWRNIGDHLKLRGGLNNLTNEKYFLWSSARRGGGHSASSTEERNRQPGTNGFIGLDFEF
ncbi:MAG: hypothetical protein CMI29_00635 [Opitutae bacterium]|nr:hypothetical protein [Opitutae bacterium]|tara:strand:- start:7146 stop:9377 length:2232 start_codon:yes stop_codon:yes gene_type:complete